MKYVVLNEVKKELSWRERSVVKVFAKTFEKVYHITRINIINNLMQF